MMLHLLLALQLSASTPKAAATNSTTEPAKVELSELSKTKAELFEAKIRIIQLEQELQKVNLEKLNSQLSSEQTDLISQFRKELKAKDDDVWDWQSHTFKAKPEEKK